MGVSELERARLTYEPRLPGLLRRGIQGLAIDPGGPSGALRDQDRIREAFPAIFGSPELRLTEGSGPEDSGPLRVGVVLSGGQAPGGHNVIAGLLDAVCETGGDARLFGFLGGPRGIFEQRYEELTRDRVAAFRNTGGFDLIGSGRDKIERPEQFEACRKVCEKLRLDGLVVIGGDDSNTNAALLAEYFVSREVRTRVIGVPKTIDGDLRGGGIETSFGFDTATRVYSELIGNICRDARSAGKYWHFVKLMGRSASHVTLECALRTRANVALIGEEVLERGLRLRDVVEQIADVVRARADAGRRHGVCLIPEGLIEFIPEVNRLISELNAVLAEEGADSAGHESVEAQERFVTGRLSKESAQVFGEMSPRIRRQLMLDRDSHGNVQVSKIDTEQLLIEEVQQRLEYWKRDGKYRGSFQVQPHFFGYEGRCAPPSNFDADYTYALGRLAAVLVAFGRTGYICAVSDLTGDPESWRALGVPLTSLMQIESRKGREVPVIGKALVDLDGAPFRQFAAHREQWQIEDAYVYPGPIQYFGPPEVSAGTTETMRLEREG